MPFWKLTKGSLGLIIDGKPVDVEKGQTVELPEEEAKKYKYLKKVGQPVSLVVQPTNQPGGEIARDWSATQDMKAAEVITLANETTSVSELESLYEVEEKGQNRPSVLKAIEKRVETLEKGA